MDYKGIVGSFVPRLIRKIHEAVAGVREGYSQVEGAEGSLDPRTASRWEWRRISSDLSAGEELDVESHRTILRRAYAAWCRNPLAGQIVNITTGFVMGKGIGYSARDPEVQDVLNRFWADPSNDMPAMQHWMSNELQIYGEIFIRYFRNPIDGSVRIALVDPLEILEIVTDPDDVRKPVAYLREYRKRRVPEEWADMVGRSGIVADFPVEDETVREVIPAEEILHVKVNNVSNRKRGLSELYRVLPWLDAYSRWIEERINVNRARGMYAYLRKVPTLPSKASGPFEADSSGKYIVPKAGSILVVHESEEWEVLSPSVGADDAKEDGRAIKLMIAAGSGIFEHYFGDPSSGNLATARSMELPMVKKFEDRQRLFEGVFGRMFGYVIESSINAGVLPKDVDTRVEVSFPPIVPDDVALLTDTLVKQVESGLLSKDSARRMIPWVGDAAHEGQVVEEENK